MIGCGDADCIERFVCDHIAKILDFDFTGYVKTVRPHLTSEQVTSLARQGFNIGAHSCDHPYYGDISLEEQLAQTRESMKVVAARFGGKFRAFAFPFNDDGVTPEFFEQVFRDKELDLTFGTNGMIRHFHHRNVQRVSMERKQTSANAIIVSEYVRAACGRL